MFFGVSQTAGPRVDRQALPRTQAEASTCESRARIIGGGASEHQPPPHNLARNTSLFVADVDHMKQASIWATTHTPVDANANTRGGGATPQRRATPLPPPFFFLVRHDLLQRGSHEAAAAAAAAAKNTQPLWVGRPAGEASDGHSRQKKNGTTKRGLPKIGHQHTPCGARTGGHGGSGARPGVKRP